MNYLWHSVFEIWKLNIFSLLQGEQWRTHGGRQEVLAPPKKGLCKRKENFII